MYYLICVPMQPLKICLPIIIYIMLQVNQQLSLMPLANPQLARINELYNLLSKSSSSDYLQRGEEPILDGLTPTQDLNLFREAQEKTKGTFVSHLCVYWYVYKLVLWLRINFLYKKLVRKKI